MRGRPDFRSQSKWEAWESAALVIEQNDRVGYSPRAKTTNVRTREHLRRWGIADNLRKASSLPLDYPSDIIFATRLNGPQLTKIENAFSCWHERNDLYSESAQWIPQYVLEEVLRAHAVTLPTVEIRFDCAYLDAAQDADGVTVSMKDLKTAREQTVRCAYLAGRGWIAQQRAADHRRGDGRQPRKHEEL